MTLDRMEQLENELAEANARRDDLRTALEWANKERDEARQERERLLDREAFLESYSETLQGYQTDLARMLKAVCAERDRLREQRDELERWKGEHQYSGGLSMALEQRDEARAEVATAARYCDELAETIRMHIAREIELGAEVERLHRLLPVHPSSLTDVCTDAFHRGAEAMREACAQRVKGEGNGHYGLTGADVAKTLRALPIPEDK